jgi:NAD-dependent DNA ligase
VTTLNQLLDDFQGMRNDVATAITDRFDSVSELASASVDRLTEIKGVGTATAERLIKTAKGAAHDAVKDPGDTPSTTEPSNSLLDRGAAVVGGALGVGIGLLRSVQHRLSA